MRVVKLPSGRWQDSTDEQLGGIRENTICLVRYGGYGDMLQCSSIFPILKKQGFRVCVNCSERGAQILKNDPHVDELLTQYDEQVPNAELGEYWDRIAPLFQGFINLGQVVEVGLLCTPNEEEYLWPTEKRHKKLNKNYSEALHDRAGVEYSFDNTFFPSTSEKKWVERERRKMSIGSNHYVIVVTLSGSSVHKAYPHMDAVVARALVTMPEVRFVMVGDEFCQILEVGWEKERRVFARSGKWSIRKTLAFAQRADLVVGPETGVLNSVSMEDVAKVVLLSHSSRENLPKYWVNTTSIVPDGVDCYPCHKIHFSFKTCNRDDETGGAMCAAKIDPNTVVKAIEYHRNLKYDVPRTLSNS